MRPYKRRRTSAIRFKGVAPLLVFSLLRHDGVALALPILHVFHFFLPFLRRTSNPCHAVRFLQLILFFSYINYLTKLGSFGKYLRQEYPYLDFTQKFVRRRITSLPCANIMIRRTRNIVPSDKTFTRAFVTHLFQGHARLPPSSAELRPP